MFKAHTNLRGIIFTQTINLLNQLVMKKKTQIYAMNNN